MNKYLERLFNGIFKENPIFILMLGLCPTLAVTTSASNGLGMGLTTTAVLMSSNILISMLRKVIPDRVRMPAYIVVVASLVTVVQFLLEAYLPALNETLGIYIPLIVVNCIILGRAESYAAKNTVALSALDGIGMGLGFTVALAAIGAVREIIGNGSVFDKAIMPNSYEPAIIFILAPGAFFVLSILTALQNKFKLKSATNGVNGSVTGCGAHCGGCSSSNNCSAINGIEEAKVVANNAEKLVREKELENNDSSKNNRE